MELHTFSARAPIHKLFIILTLFKEKIELPIQTYFKAVNNNV